MTYTCDGCGKVIDSKAAYYRVERLGRAGGDGIDLHIGCLASAVPLMPTNADERTTIYYRTA